MQRPDVHQQIENSYTYHAPKGTQVDRYEQLRAKAKELADLAANCCPDSRERSIGFTNLEQSVMWFNKSIACNE